MKHHRTITTFAMLWILLLAHAGIAATADFFTAPSFPVGAATSVATGDFNNDGITDVVSAGSGTVSVLLGNKNGSFQPAVNYTVTSAAAGLAVGDFNNDGRPDIAVLIGTGSVGMNLLLGNGDGSFQSAHSLFFQGLLREAFVVADFNGDGSLDVAVANNRGKNISVLFGNGDGSFQSEVNYSTGTTRTDTPFSISLGDVNNDGKLDLVVGQTGNVKIFLANGDGTFQAAISGPAGVGNRVYLGDLNGDGKLDLLGTFSSGVQTSLGNGDGTFQTPVTYDSDVGSSNSTQQLAVLDLNGDGKADVVLASALTNGLSVLLGNGDGSLQPAVNYGVGTIPQALVVGRFGVGQKLGLAVGDGGLFVSEALINKDGSLQAPHVTIVPSLQTVAAGDLNNDGKMDIALGSGGSLDILFGNGDGTFQAPVSYTQTVSITSIAIGDLNGDGKADVVVSSTAAHNQGVVLVFLNNGNGTLGSPVTYNVGSQNFGIALGDFNGDHKLDVAVVDLVGSALNVMLNNGDGTFQSAIATTTTFLPQHVALADFNGDGKLDAAVQGTRGVSVMLGNGNGTFSVNNSSVGQNPVDLRAADFNHDGKPDLVVSDGNGKALDVLLNKGDGTFGKALITSLAVTPLHFEVGDFNGDGNQDIAVATDTQILNGNGNGTFQPAVSVGGCNGTFEVVANFNADSRPDLLNACTSLLEAFPNAAGPH